MEPSAEKDENKDESDDEEDEDDEEEGQDKEASDSEVGSNLGDEESPIKESRKVEKKILILFLIVLVFKFK